MSGQLSPVLIAGGGIAGMAMGLTCHQIGVPFVVVEAARTIQPLGVGINLQPTATRELFDLGLKDALAAIGVPTRDYGMYSKHGLHIWTEPRGIWAGYRWPQYSVHRGKLHMMLYKALVARAGAKSVQTGWRATGFDNRGDHVRLHVTDKAGEKRVMSGSLLIGADGIHSAIRQQMYPYEGPPKWGGAVLWRGTAQAQPFKTGASMVMIGYSGLRFVAYPISRPDTPGGRAEINWIANLNYEAGSPWNKEDWNREAHLGDFLPRFEHFDLGWIDIPGLIRSAARVFEYPMVDRDPVGQWTFGRVSLMGDAAHAAYPVGSNGAGSAIIDARKIGAAFLAHGVTPDALAVYEHEMRAPMATVTLMNRTAGPDSILDVVEERSGGQFDNIDDVVPQSEMAAHAARYKAAAGFGIEATNAAPRTIAEGARV